MELICPIKQGIKVKKWYGLNSELKSLEDFKLCITQNFGEMLRDYSGVFGLAGHNGIDIAYQEGTEVYASHDGIAVYTEDSQKGLGVVVVAPGYKTIYWHFKSSPLSLNTPTQVKRGQLLGYGDNTGYSTGHHLHYGLKLLDNSGNVLNRDNGYDGCVDPMPYLVWWDTMSQEEVKKQYRLSFYRDPTSEELAHWSGKPLLEFLNTAIKDRANFLNSSIIYE